MSSQSKQHSLALHGSKTFLTSDFQNIMTQFATYMQSPRKQRGLACARLSWLRSHLASLSSLDLPMPVGYFARGNDEIGLPSGGVA